MGGIYTTLTQRFTIKALTHFVPFGLFLYSLTKSEKLWFSDVSRGNRKRPDGMKWSV